MKFDVIFKSESNETLGFMKFEMESFQKLNEEIKKLLEQDYITIQQTDFYGTIIVCSKIAKVLINKHILP